MNRVSDELLAKMIKKALSNGGDYADVFIEHQRPLSIMLEDDKIEKLTSGIDAGIGVRVIFGDKSAYAYSNDFSEKSLVNLAETVSRAVKEKKEDEITIDLTRVRPPVSFEVKQNPADIEMKSKILLVENANRTAKAVSPKIKQVSVIYRDSVQNLCIATSDGTIAEEERIHTLALIQVIAADGDVLQTAYEPVAGLVGFELFEENPFDEIAEKAARKAVALLSAKKAPGGRMPVIISSEAGGTMIHEAIGHGLEADLVQQGLSVFSDKIGQKVASPTITIIDDSTLSGKRGSFAFDDEGVNSQKTVLVENGILKGYMHSRLTSMKEGAVSTGKFSTFITKVTNYDRQYLAVMMMLACLSTTRP